jgi:hypothetical protein
MSRSELAREAIADYLERRERERFLRELVDEARQVMDQPERLDGDWMRVDKEALEIAEGGGGRAPSTAPASATAP